LRLELKDVSFSYGPEEVLKGITAFASPGMTSFIGPNAAGKSTLLKCIAGILRPGSGSMSLGGESLMGKMDDPIRKQVAYMPQEPPYRTSLTVMEVMLMGRLDDLRWKVGQEDIQLAYGALEDLGIEHLARRPMHQLSGGQSQMVMIAQCLVREPQLIMMDEPMNNLDLQKQLEMFDTLEAVTRGKSLTTVMVLHDINFAARFSDRMVVLSHGEVYDVGPPADVITEGMLRDVYGVESRIAINGDGIPHVDPLYSLRTGERPRCKRMGCELCQGDVLSEAFPGNQGV